jgi:anti-sigma regulatory factor (Ser/Thr protein kinase)
VTSAPAHHGVLVYDSDEAFAEPTAAFLEGGTTDGEGVVAVVDPAQRQMLDDALGDATAHVTFLDRDSQYTRPEAAIAAYDAMLRRTLRDGAPSVRLYGELPPCTTTEEWDGWIAYDAILNRAFEGQPVSIMCGYDTRALPARVIDGARRTHPEIRADAWERNPRYDDPAEVVRSLTPESRPTPDLTPLVINGDPRALRAQLTQALAAAGFAGERAHGMLLAASEVFANARRHGGGAEMLRVGSASGRFVCEISDRGPGLDDPMVGYLPPGPTATAGAGLWVARQLTERLELLGSGAGLTARLWI